MINKVILFGNLGNNPDIRTLNNGGKVANISLATSERYKDKATGEYKTKTEWHKVVCYSQYLVEMLERKCSKGSCLYIEGSIKTTKYNKDNVEKYITEVIADKILALNSKENIDSNNSVNKSYTENNSDDDIPF
jgi:single-strand DNA-binding protein